MPGTLSILGIWNYNPVVFTEMVIPAGIDKQNLVDNLLIQCAEYEILYPDPVFMQKAIGIWSKKMLPVWEHLKETTEYEYNAIDNYNRHEDYTDINTATASQNSFENAGFVDAVKNNGRLEHRAHLYGNIGVTTTQEMIKQEREIAQFNIVDQIIEDFKNRFCLLIY